MKFNFKTLSKREQYAVYTAGVVIVLFILFQLIIFPLAEKRKRLVRSIDVKTRMLQEMQNLTNEYGTLNQQSDISKINFKDRESGFTLFSFLDRLSGQAGVKNNITYMKPSTTTGKNTSYKLSQVELKLVAVNLKQLASYLYMIETSKNMIFIKRLSVTQSAKPEGFIDVIMQVETYES